MSAFLGISVWVTLATVVPGLITIAVLFWSVVVVHSEWLNALREPLVQASDWVWAGIGVTLMVLTQAIGIIVEGMLINKKWLGDEEIDIAIPEGIDPRGETKVKLQPYFEYAGLYVLLSELQENEDSQGHLKRCLSQFFLSLNTLVSFSAGMILTICLTIAFYSEEALVRGSVYCLFLLTFFVISFKVTKIRFEVMARALWAARRRRLSSRLPCKS